MPNNSSTGGYLVPTSTGGDLNDKALAQFLQQIVVNITGLPGPMVRPRWQPEPPNIPDFGTSWCAIGPGVRTRDKFPYLKQNGSGNGSTTVVKNRQMEIIASFYGPSAEQNAEYLAMGLDVPQNRELMQLQGFNIIGGAGDSVVVPSLFKQRWQYIVDITFTVRQQLQYTFAVENLNGATGQLIADDQGKEITESLVINPPPPA